MTLYKGTPVSPGIAIGPAWIYRRGQLVIKRYQTNNPDLEWERVEKALDVSRKNLQVLYNIAQEKLNKGDAAIFEAHLLLLDDPELLRLIREKIFSQLLNAEAAVNDSVEHFANMLISLSDEYFSARAQDVRDVGQHILRSLLGFGEGFSASPEYPAIILADDLMPSDTLQFNRENVLALCTMRGSATSHAAILARSLGVPAIVRAEFPFEKIENGTQVIADGSQGILILQPSQSELEQYERLQRQWLRVQHEEIRMAEEPAITRDGRHIQVVANVGNLQDALKALEYGAEGIGLLRTEFLYLNTQSMPLEEEQVEAYRQIFAVFSGKPIVVRSLDIGGDKTLGYLGIRNEPNPFLGWRGVRMIDGRPDVLYSQFRAILLAGAGFDLHIMMPMVSSLDEVDRARGILDQARQDLLSERRKIAEQIQFGIMVEVPSVAVLARAFAEKVDFFSIGTNDLTQYTLAVDRTNDRVAELASPFDPAVIHLITQTIQAGHESGIWVGLCGEMAGDPLATPLLIGLGLDEFSMAATAIPLIKRIIRACSFQECKAIASHVLELTTREAVENYLREQAPLPSLLQV